MLHSMYSSYLSDMKDLTQLLGLLGLDHSSKLTLRDQRLINENLQITDSRDVIRMFLYRLSLGRQTALQDLADDFKSLNDERGLGGGDDGIRDILYAILTCCDAHLLQEVLRNLALTGNAVPIILPMSNQNPVLLNWGLRRYYMKILRKSLESVVRQPFVAISAIRFGKVGISKSKVLNDMVSKVSNSDARLEIYLSENKDNSLSKGVVECAWCLPMQGPLGHDDMDTPLAVLNLRGDSLKYTRQADFCCKVANTVIVFVEPPIHDDIKRRIKHLAESTHICLVSTNASVNIPLETMKNVTVN